MLVIMVIIMKKIIAVLISLLFVASTFGVATIFGKTGGPDTFGYTYEDTVPYQWIDISGTCKTDPGLKSDDNVVEVPIGFDFKFYGNTYDKVGVSTNGYLIFGSTDNHCTNQDIPSTNNPNNIICAFWDDLYPPTAGKVYYQSFPDKFIVQWDGIPHIVDSGLPPPRSSMTFQIILYRNSNAIKFQYKEMTNGQSTIKSADGRSATVGIENIDGTVGLKYYYKNDWDDPPGPIKDGLAIGFKYPGTRAPWENGTLPMAQILKIVKDNKDKE